MQKKSTSQSGLFNIRTIFAVTLCSIALSLGWFSVASSPSTGTISTGTPVQTYTAGPFNQANPSPLGAGQLDTGPRCTPTNAFPCDSYDLKVNLPVGYTADSVTGHPQASVKVTMSWTDAGTGQSDYDLYIFTGTVADSSLSGNTPANYQSASGSNPEVAAISPLVADGTDHHYTIKIVPYTPSGETVTVRVELLPGPFGGAGGGGGSGPFGGADATAPGVPRFMNFYAPDGSSAQSGNGEFNIGFNPATGRIMTMNIGPIWRITPYEVQHPGGPECCEGLWEDKSNAATNTGLDPILWTDQSATTSRTFSSNSTVGANAVYGWSDNDGDTWVPIGIAAPNGGADHETIGSGPYPPTLSALANPTVNRNHAAYYCSQDIVGPAACYRSDTLGVSWGASTLAYTGQGTGCGGLHGHIHVAPDGTAWLPVNQCTPASGPNLQGGVFSTDGGTTWTTFFVPNGYSQQQGADPSIAIDHKNRIYYAYVRNEPVGANPAEGHARVAVGDRNGTSINWLYDVDIGRNLPLGTVTNGDHQIVNAAEIEAVGDSATPNGAAENSSVPGRAAVGFLGTNQPGDYQALGFPGDWYAFIATTYNGGQTWTTVNATPNDPVQHATGVWQQGGSAQDRNLLDFNEITIDDKGRVLYGYSDGCVTSGCIAGTAGNDFVAFMRVARQTGGETLVQPYDGNTDILTGSAIAPKAPCLSGTRDSSGSHLTWKAPDNGGANITQYKIYRGTSSNGEGSIPIGTSITTKFDDTTADPNVAHYFYKVAAVNSVTAPNTGPNSNEIDLQVTISVVQNPCLVPGVDLAPGEQLGDSTASVPQFPVGGPTPAPSPLPQTTPGPGADIKSVHLAQPYAPSPNPIKLIFEMDTDTGVAAQPLGTGWFIAMKIAGDDPATVGVETSYYRGVRMEGTGTGVAFYYYTPGANTSGTVDGRFVNSKTQITAGCSYDPANGKIIITANASDLTLSPGTVIQGFVSGTSQTTDLIGIGAGATEVYDFAPNSGAFTPVAAYPAVNPNSLCAPNNPPIAAIIAYPTGSPSSPPEGDPPLAITFDASGSHDPDSGDSIASYQFNFADGGSATCPGDSHCIGAGKVTHTYTSNGDFGVQLKVTDSHGLISANTALVNVDVDLPLNDAVSTKTHGATAYPIHLINPGGTASEETRGLAATNNTYTLVYTFDSAYTISSIDSANVKVNGNNAGTASPSAGPAANQMTVTLTGIATAQHLAITANGIHATNSSAPSTPLTLTSTLPMDVLVGDSSRSGNVDSADVGLVQRQNNKPVSPSNFWMDFNASGNFDSADVSIAQRQNQKRLP